MPFLGSPDKIIVSNSQFSPDIPETQNHLVTIFQRFTVFSCGGVLKFLAMFVGAG
jgi:hypothetical protein